MAAFSLGAILLTCPAVLQESWQPLPHTFNCQKGIKQHHPQLWKVWGAGGSAPVCGSTLNVLPCRHGCRVPGMVAQGGCCCNSQRQHLLHSSWLCCCYSRANRLWGPTHRQRCCTDLETMLAGSLVVQELWGEVAVLHYTDAKPWQRDHPGEAPL